MARDIPALSNGTANGQSKPCLLITSQGALTPLKSGLGCKKSIVRRLVQDKKSLLSPTNVCPLSRSDRKQRQYIQHLSFPTYTTGQPSTDDSINNYLQDARLHPHSRSSAIEPRRRPNPRPALLRRHLCRNQLRRLRLSRREVHLQLFHSALRPLVLCQHGLQRG
jgi:hypothetical protein